MTVIGISLNQRYRLEEELGRGGMGVVYRARDTMLDRDVAVKVLSGHALQYPSGQAPSAGEGTALSTEGRARLLREAQATAQLNHTNVVSVYDAGEAELPGSVDAVPFIVMELVEGDSLHDCPPDGLEAILDIASQVCTALDHAHAHGVIHRDLKPENVLLLPDGSAKLVDFGLARTVASRLTAEGAILGTVFYIAPEQALGQEIDGRADLYTLGVMLYEWTTGRLPFEGEDPLTLLGQHLHAPVVPPREHNAEIPPALDALIVQLMSKQPEDRPASAEEVRQVLEALAREPDAAEAPLARPRPPAFLAEAEEREVERPPFVARQRELARLDRFLEEALAGQGRVVFVTGGAGRGKTALLDEFAQQALEKHAGLLVASGNCNAYSGVGDPYLPFREVLGMLTGDVEARWAAGAISREQTLRLWEAVPEAIQALLDHGPHVVHTLVPGRALKSRVDVALPASSSLRGRLDERLEAGRGDSESLEQSYLFQQVTNVLCTLAGARPLLLVLDDLQWADTASISLLFHLGRRVGDAHILIACAYRPEEVALGREGARPGERERHPLESILSEFKRRYGPVWVDLAETEGRGFVDAFLDTEPNRLGQDFRRALFAHTGGHPLFTVELLRAMQERGDLIQDAEGGWSQGPELDWETLPARVEAVIEERIGRLDSELRDILTVAGVEGQDFTVQVVARVQEIDERRLLKVLSQELERRHGLVREEGGVAVGARRLTRYRFSHALFQQYLYHILSDGERMWLHRDIGLVLEELYQACPEEIAVQLVRHFAGDPDREWTYAKLAGERAAAHYANEEAVGYLSRALELAPETADTERYALLLARERVYGLLGEREAQARDLAALQTLADTLSDPRKRAEVSFRQSDYARLTSDYQAAAAAARQGVALAQEAGDTEEEARGHLAWGQALMRQGDYGGTTEHLGRTLDLARGVGSARLVAAAVRLQGVVAFYQGDQPGARKSFEQALSAAREAGSRRSEAFALNNLGAVAGDQGDLPSARGYFEQTLAIKREIGDRIGEGLALNNLGVVARDMGDYGAAQTYLEQALAIYREILHRQGEVYILNDLASVARAQGDCAAARDYYEQSLLIARDIGDRRGEAYALTGLGDCLAELGQWAEAAEACQQAVDLRQELHQPHLEMESRAGAARAARAQGNLAQAQDDVAAILAHLDAGNSLDGTDEPLRIYLTCYQVLLAAQDERADEILEAAHQALQERAARLADENARRAYLEGVPWHREIVRAYSGLNQAAGRAGRDLAAGGA
jgi:predicted ATPase